MLQKLSTDISRLIKAQQYIHNTYIIVKELVENSLDANSTVIKIAVDNSCIIVEDNGDGIEDLMDACLVGYTSKEDNSYKVLGIEYAQPIFNHGFRGQALSSIREQCDIEITSKCRETVLATYKNYSTGEIKPCSRENGTTVRVSNLFKNCPIRKNINEKELRKHLTQILNLLKSFIYVYEIHLTLIWWGKTLFLEQGSADTKQFSISKHGHPYLEIAEDRFEFYLFPFDKTKTQVTFFHKRVCHLDRIPSIIERIFRIFFDYSPTYVFILKDDGDINLAIDKTEVILKNSKYIESKIKSGVEHYFSSKQLILESSKKIKACDVPFDEYIFSPETRDGSNTRSECLEYVKTQSIGKALDTSQDLSDLGITSNLQNDPIEPDLSIQENNSNHPTSSRHDDGATEGHCRCSIPGSDVSIVNTRDLSGAKSAYACIKEECLHYSSTVIEKSDFGRMKIIGQFNQGFILCVLGKEKKRFLIAVDQHAADEIYNFERLKGSFVLKKQQLLKPIKLKLTAIQELLIDENRPVLEKNGFMVADGMLVAIPVYKGVFFSVDDFYLLLENIAVGTTVSSKYRDIMASKACRTSVMIGSGLGFKDMRRIVDNLGCLNLPWNCPHGRPTFKILTEL